MTTKECPQFVSDCHVRAAVELISHTWDPVVLSALRLGPTRRNALLDRIPGLSDKALTESLRRLSSRRLVGKTPSTGQVGAAHYELTSLGASLADGPLARLGEWASANQDELADNSPPLALASAPRR